MPETAARARFGRPARASADRATRPRRGAAISSRSQRRPRLAIFANACSSTGVRVAPRRPRAPCRRARRLPSARRSRRRLLAASRSAHGRLPRLGDVLEAFDAGEHGSQAVEEVRPDRQRLERQARGPPRRWRRDRASRSIRPHSRTSRTRASVPRRRARRASAPRPSSASRGRPRSGRRSCRARPASSRTRWSSLAELVHRLLVASAAGPARAPVPVPLLARRARRKPSNTACVAGRRIRTSSKNVRSAGKKPHAKKPASAGQSSRRREAADGDRREERAERRREPFAARRRRGRFRNGRSRRATARRARSIRGAGGAR